jgi:type IV pilus assembly protein PilW
MLNRMRSSTGQRGLSIVELMVGMTVGLFVLAGASMVTASQLSDNRKLLLEAQIQQDMRAAMDIIMRDVRRSGYWANAFKSVSPATTVAANPYATAGVLPLGTDVVLAYTTSRDEDSFHAETNNVEANEWNGFKLNPSTHAIEAQLSSTNFQPLTDPSVVRITTFTAVVNTTAVELPVCSTPPCAMVSAPGPLTAACGGVSSLLVRDVTLTIAGEAAYDPTVKRSLVSTVRLRNDQVCQ